MWLPAGSTEALSWLQWEEVGQGRKEMSLPPAVETSGNFWRAAEISLAYSCGWGDFCIYKDTAKDRDTVLCYKVDVAFPCSSLLLPLPAPL